MKLVKGSTPAVEPDSESAPPLKSARKPEAKTATLNLRLTPSLKSAAEKAAQDDSRTLPSLIEKLLKDDMQARGYLPRVERPRRRA